MLEHYFTKPATLDRVRACWLGEQIEAHVGQLEALAHAPRVVLFRVPLLRQFAEFSSRNGVQVVADLPSQASPFTAERMARSPSATTRSAERLRQWKNETRRPIEQFLGQLLPDFLSRERSPKCTREPFEDTVPGFFGYLLDERGLRPTTIYAYHHALSLFEAYLVRFEIDTLGELSVPVVSGFVTMLSDKHGPDSTTRICSSIRVLLPLRTPRRARIARSGPRVRHAADLPSLQRSPLDLLEGCPADARRGRSAIVRGQARLRDPAASGHLRTASAREPCPTTRGRSIAVAAIT